MGAERRLRNESPVNEFYNPDSWMDLLDHIWIGLVFIGIAAVPSWFAYRNHAKIQHVSDEVKGVSAQVVNGHTTPFREDVDDIRIVLDEMRTDMHLMKSDVSDIRDELRQERKDRLELDDRFENFRRFKWKGR